MTTRTIFAYALATLITAATMTATAQAQSKGPKKTSAVVGLVCTWSAYSVNKESLLVDIGNKAVYWVNQNQKLEVMQFNSGRIVLRGVRAVLQTSQSQAEKRVPMEMVIDRISGEFIVRQKVHPYQGPGACRKQRLF